MGLLFSAAIGFGAQAPGPLLTLREAVLVALANNERMLSSRETIEQAQFGRTLAESAFGTRITPNVFGSFGQSHVRNQPYGIGASKQFTTGTEVRMDVGASTFEVAPLFSDQLLRCIPEPPGGTGMTTKRRRQYTATFKKRVALEALRGDRTVQAIAAKHEIHPNQVGAWKRQAIDGLEEVFAGGRASRDSEHEATVRDLHAKIGELTVERDFFLRGLER